MTIAIALQVNDGVVLASDSASTLVEGLPQGQQILNVYNNANKIFNLFKGLPIGAMTYGAGSIGAASISTLAKDLRHRFIGDDPANPNWKVDPDSYTMTQIADKAREFLFDEHWVPLNMPAAPGTQLGFIVAGYSAGAKLSEVWLVEVADGKCPAPVLLFGQGVTDVYAGGDPEVYSRLYLGHGTQLALALENGGVAKANVPSVVIGLEAAMRVRLIEPPMPIADAIDLAEFLVRTTIEFTKFKRGAPTVGGPVESAVITKHERFKWVNRKHYFDKTLNPES